jgi:hypothetical protein
MTQINAAAINAAPPVPMPRIVAGPAIANFGFLFNASSCLTFGPFIALWHKPISFFP